MKGQKNSYTCDTCGGVLVTVDSDEGVTPFTLGCYMTRDCGGRMRSNFYPQNETTAGEPSHEWRKPTRAEYRRMSPGMREHVDKGGLNIYRLNPGDGPSEGIRDKAGKAVRTIYRSEREMRPPVANVNRSREAARRVRQMQRRAGK